MKSIYVFLFLSLFMATGCKYFKRSKTRDVDTIKADTTPVNAVDSSAYFSASQPQPEVNMPAPQAVQGRYYMIVGCFTVPQNADNYAARLKSQGYNAVIIPGRDNFQMVAANSYTNLKDGVADIDKFRNEVMPNAWVYKKR